MKITVWVSDWQFQCCGNPFSVGDRVEWVLVASPRGTEFDALLAAVLGEHAPAPVELNAWETVTDGNWEVVIARAAGLSVQLTEPPAVTDRGTMICDVVHEEHHTQNPAAPATVATVTAISEVTWALEPGLAREGHRTMRPVPGSGQLTEVTEIDRWVRNPDGGCFAGWLVELDVHDAAPRAGR